MSYNDPSGVFELEFGTTYALLPGVCFGVIFGVEGFAGECLGVENTFVVWIGERGISEWYSEGFFTIVKFKM